MKKIDVSVIIVNYKVEKELLECIQSIKDSNPKANYEIIIVDNDEEKSLEKPLKKKFPEVIYIPNPVNNGWGGGINEGVKKASGEFLYFLNPDTILSNGAIDSNIELAQKIPHAGVIASILQDFNGEYFWPLGSRILTPFRAVLVLSILEQLSILKPFYNWFFYKTWDRTSPLLQEVPPLTASLIRKETFLDLGMFDERYFLYFEEFDFGIRMHRKGYKSYLNPHSVVKHMVGASTKQRRDSNSYFIKSRMVYFKKHFGVSKARMVEVILRRDLSVRVV